MNLLESPRGGDSNKYTKRIICKKCSKVSVTEALDGFCQVSLQQLYFAVDFIRISINKCTHNKDDCAQQ